MFALIEHHEQKKLFSGSIEFPYHMDFDLCIFYKGEKLTIEQQRFMPAVQFSFLDSKDTHTMYLIVTNAVTCCTEIANTLQSLCITPEYEYICYKMQASREFGPDDQIVLTWDIQDYVLEKNIIPHNSLIVLFDPKLIAGLEVQSWKPENVFRIVPTLRVLPSAPIQAIERAMRVARLAALDIDAVHAKKMNSQSTSAILTAMQ